MDQLSPIPFDYLEILLVQHIGNSDSVKYDIPEPDFNSYLQRLKSTPYKYFQTDSQECAQGNLFLVKKIENNAVTESKAYQVNPLEIIDSVPGFRIVAYEKKKLATIAFQSTKSLDHVKHKRKLIFRVNNRIYINFQYEYCEGEVHRKIFVNFNNSKDADQKESFNIIQGILEGPLAPIMPQASTC